MGYTKQNLQNRRTFLQNTLWHTGALSLASSLSVYGQSEYQNVLPRTEYQGPNVILVRFGGGVRRRETIDEEHTYAPYFCHELAKRGTLFTNMEISQFEGIETSHGQGTLYILTGRYDKYEDIGNKFLGQRFEPEVPTIFEYLRKNYQIPEHQTLIVNGEDRTDEEFYTFSNHHLFGAKFRSNVLSLYRFKVYLLRRQLEQNQFPEEEREAKEQELEKLEEIDYRLHGASTQSDEIDAFWERWREYYGESGLVNPRGDRLLTELSIRALKELRPRLMMINYNDPDYVHWGNPAHYTLGISAIDRGIQRLVEFVDHDEFYAGHTVFVFVPDCGRDSNRFMPVPFQHHFNSKSSHEIFALLMGPGIAKGQVVHSLVNQVSITPTVGHLMAMDTDYSEGEVLEQAIV